MWTMIGTYNYVLFTNDTDWLSENWAGYLKAMSYIESHLLYASGLLDVIGTRDWGRFNQGYNNSEAQMMYVVLHQNALELILIRFRLVYTTLSSPVQISQHGTAILQD